MKKNNKKTFGTKPRGLGGWKLKLLMAIMALVAARGVAIEKEGTILWSDLWYDAKWNAGLTYYIDINRDNNMLNRLTRYLAQPNCKIIFEDEGMENLFGGFGAGLMIGFFAPNGDFVRLDQMFSGAEIQRYFPYLWAKIQAEQRAGR
jgi:hypothetical protein